MAKIEEKIIIPEGTSCTYQNSILTCKKDSIELSRNIYSPDVSLVIKDNTIFFQSKKLTKKERKVIHTFIKHIGNLFSGLTKKFEYKLEAANVHFPMSIKVEDNVLKITNFLGEKVPRHAKILPKVDIDVKGQVITISSNDKESAGQTAANIEKATRINNRDRRIFQDGIYITEKPGDKK
jgi:large subunit ribosomal protein L6